MKILSEQSLTEFRFWSGAKTNAQKLSEIELNEVEKILEELFPQGIDETQLNDIFWFDFDMVLSWLGYATDEEE